MAIQLNHRQNRITTGSNAETAGVVLEVFNTGALILPKGADADKVSATEVAGAFRFNTTSSTLEYYNGTIWVQIFGGFTEDLRGADGEFIVDGVTVGSTAVNYVTITNADTGNGVTIESTGTDTNVDLGIAAKGAGEVTVGTGTGDVATFVGGGAAELTVTVNATDADVTTTGNLNLVGNNVNIYDGANKVAEFRNTGGNDALIVDAVASGVSISVAGSAPSELFFGQEVNMNNNKIVGLADPTDNQDAATKAYVDAAINGLDWKNSVRVASTANIDLTTGGLLTIDGVTLVAGDRVLVKNQTNQTENGIYVAAVGAWSRSSDADNSPQNEVSGGLATFVTEGTVNNGTAWVMTAPSGEAVLGTDNLVFAQFSGPGSINIIGGDGISSSVAGNTWTIDADTDGVTIFATGGAGSQLSVKSTSTTGQVLRSTGIATDAAVWGALDLANTDAVTGVLAEANGGTGESTYSVGDVLVGDATGLTKLALGADKTFLASNGTNLVYTSVAFTDLNGIDTSGAVTNNVLVFDGTNWVDGTVNLASSDAVSGILPVSNGGTGITSLPQGHIVFGNGTDAVSTLTIGTATDANTGYVLKTNTSGNAPEWGTLTLNQLDGVDVSGATNNQVLQFVGGQWVSSSINLVDELVKVNASDTTSGYLEDKVGVDVSGALNVTTVGNATVEFAVRTDGVTIHASNNNDLAVKSTATAGQILRSTGTATDDAVWGALDLANTNAVTGTLALTNGGTGLNTVAARSVLVANTADTLIALQATTGSNKLLRWNDTLSTYEFVDQNLVGGFAFETITPSGNGNTTSVAADSTSDTLGVVGGTGIAINGDAGLTTLTFEQTLSGLAAVGTVAGGDTITLWQGGTLGTTTFTDVIDDLDLVTIPGTSTGMLVQISDGVFAARTIEAATSADRVGIAIVDGNGIGGNPTVGLDLVGLPTNPVEGTDFVIFYDGSGTANSKVAVTDLLAVGADNTRINDAADTTYVDTDEVAGRVVVASNEGTVAEFVGSSANSDFFVFNTATSAGTIRMEASGASTDIDIRIVPKGNGEVFIGDAGNGVIQADDTFNLTVAGGDNGGDLILKGGTTGGEVLIQNAAGDELVTFGDDNTVTHYAAVADSFSKDYVLRFATTGAGTDTENIAIPANGTVLLEGYVVARETSLATTNNHAGYKFRAVVYNTGGTATILDSVVEEIIAESPAALQVAVTVNAANAVITVTGATGVNMTWTGFVKAVTVVS